MPTRALVLALLLAPLLLFGAREILRSAGTEKLMPGVDAAADVARIEIARGHDQVVLARRADTGAWEILSAADAPGNAAMIEATIRALADLRGAPRLADTAPPVREPLEVRLTARSGDTIGHAAFWVGEARRLPDGPRLALEGQPALPLWPSAWTSLAPPAIAASDVASVHRLSARGAEVLPPAERNAVTRMLAALDARDFASSATVNWAGARQLRVLLADGSSVDLQQVPDGEGRFFLRMTSDSRTDVREARRYAFRVADPLP